MTIASPSCELREVSAHRFALTGELTFATQGTVHAFGESLVRREAELEIDCDALAGVDSAGLAVLLDWLAAARAVGHRLTYVGLPASLLQLARISEVDGFLRGA